MDWARVWMQFTRILSFLSDVGDTVILMIASRMVRDNDECRRRTTSRFLEKGFLILDMLLTIMFLFLAACTLHKSKHENPIMPLRFWIVVFMFYCVFHMFFSIVNYKGGQWSHAGFTLFKDLECRKNAFGAFWWGLGMFFMVRGADQMYLDAPELTWILTFFLCFDVAFAICCMLFLFTIFVVLFCLIPIVYATLYYMRNRQNRQRRVQLPPCPWCHK